MFTSERAGDGQTGVYRVRADGTGEPEAVMATPSFEGQLVLSPDGTKGAYVTTANGNFANIWVVNLNTKEAWNVTDIPGLTRTEVSADLSPRSHLRPAWSPSGEWISFSSDRETSWAGHSSALGWEHPQSLSIYTVRPDWTGFRKVATNGSDFSCKFQYPGLSCSLEG